jgi:hypothetical protein
MMDDFSSRAAWLMLTRDDDFTSLAEDVIVNRGRVTSCFTGYHTGHHNEGHRRFNFSGRYIRIWSQVRQLWRPGSWDFGE